MQKIYLLCLWSSINFFSYTDLSIIPQDISNYGVIFAANLNLPFVIWHNDDVFDED